MNPNQADDMQVLIEEVARIALEHFDTRDFIGHELNATDEELENALSILNERLNAIGETA